jgi:TM2 domain-containing membrane protein YozV/ribosomal protein L40E
MPYGGKKEFDMAMIFCSECGAKMSSMAVSCPKCGNPNNTLTKSVNGLYNGNKSIVVYLVLCWFFGIVGAHRYYAGKTGSAIAMTILTITIFGIVITTVWTLVDLIVGFCNLETPKNIFEIKNNK